MTESSEHDTRTPGARARRVALALVAVTGVGAFLGLAVYAMVVDPPIPPFVEVASSTVAPDDTAFQGAPEVNAAAADALAERGFATLNQGSADPLALEAARARFVEAQALDPYNISATFGVGWSHHLLGDLTTAERYYDVALSLVEVSPNATVIEHYAHYNRGILYLHTGRDIEAEIELCYAERLGADPTAESYQPVRLRVERGTYELAKLAYRQVVQSGSAEPFDRWTNGLALWRAGDLEAARSLFFDLSLAPPG